MPGRNDTWAIAMTDLKPTWCTIFEGRKYWLCRLPEQCAGGSGWIRLHKDLHTITFNEDGQPTAQPSILINLRGGPRRHFWLKAGRLHFCTDDQVCPGQTAALASIRRMWITGMLNLLPAASQRAPMAMPGEDY